MSALFYISVKAAFSYGLDLLAPCQWGSHPDYHKHKMLNFTVSIGRKYTLLSSRVLKTEGGKIESRGCHTLTIELVQTGLASFWNLTMRLGSV